MLARACQCGLSEVLVPILTSKEAYLYSFPTVFLQGDHMVVAIT